MNIKIIFYHILIMSFLSSGDCYAQISKRDSLESLLALSDDDIHKINLLNELAYMYIKNNPMKTDSLAIEAMDLSHKLNYNKGATEAIRMRGVAFKVTGRYDSAFYYYGMAYDLSQKYALNDIKASVLNNMGNVYRNLGNYDSARCFYLKSLEIRRQIGHEDDIASSLLNIGNLYNYQGQLKQALRYYEESEEMFLKTNNQVLLAVVLNNLGGISQYMSAYTSALNYYQRSAIIRNDLGIKEGLGTLYTNIGQIYGLMNDREQQIDHYMQARDIYLERGDMAGLARALSDIGQFYNDKGEREKALRFLSESLKIYREIGNYCQEINPLMALARVYDGLDQKQKAKTHFLESLKGARECHDINITSKALTHLADFDRNEGNYRKAREKLEEAYSIASASGLELMEIMYAFYLLHKATGRHAEALASFEKYKQRQDSIYNKTNTLEMVRLEASYELDKVKKEQESQRQIREAQQEKTLTKEVYIRNIFIIGFAGMLAITFLMYRNYRNKKRDIELLNQLNLEIQENQKELRTKAEDLKVSNEKISYINQNLEAIVSERTKLIGEQNQKIVEYLTYNSHQVRGPLARVLGLAALLEANSIRLEEQQSVFKRLNFEARNLDNMVTSMNRELEQGKQLK